MPITLAKGAREGLEGERGKKFSECRRPPECSLCRCKRKGMDGKQFQFQLPFIPIGFLFSLRIKKEVRCFIQRFSSHLFVHQEPQCCDRGDH